MLKLLFQKLESPRSEFWKGASNMFEDVLFDVGKGQVQEADHTEKVIQLVVDGSCSQ